MRYVVIRDDDTSGLSSPEVLESLYRPFLDRGFPINLSIIPNVNTGVKLPNGDPEGYLKGASLRELPRNVPIGVNQNLVRYLLDRPGYTIVQHGYQHIPWEFYSADSVLVTNGLDHGTRLFQEAGFVRPKAFVAPHDRLSRLALVEVAKRFQVISTGWYEFKLIPAAWRPRYILKKLLSRANWQVPGTRLLTHPGCIVIRDRSAQSVLDQILQRISQRRLTVIVLHWWEVLEENGLNRSMIDALHEFADYLARDSNTKAVSFNEIAAGNVPL